MGEMRRRGNECDGGGVPPLRDHRHDTPGKQDPVRPILFVVVAAVLGCIVCWAACRHATSLAQHASPGSSSTEESRTGIQDSTELRRWYAMSDEDVLRMTQDDVQRFLSSSGDAVPNYGISRGAYSRISPHSRLLKIAGFSNPAEVEGMRFACNFDVFRFRPSNSTPPDAPPHSSLLLPGLLSHRQNLPNTALCFLFYTELLWTRATGGAKGAALARVVSGDNRIGDKEVLAGCLEEYRERHGCDAPGFGRAGRVGGYPETVLLKDKDVCERFFHANHIWAHEEDAIWFVKDAHGSLGRHIQLLRRKDVSAMAENGSYACPMPGRVASLEVPNMWVPRQRKFDQRFYVLIPSLNPLIILTRRGYLRFSKFRYSRSKVEGEDSELDRMRHVTNLAIQLYDAILSNSSARKAVGGQNDDAMAGGVLQPPSRLKEELLLHMGPEEGERAHRRLERSARNSILQIVYSIRRKLAPWDMAQKNVSQTWALLSMDIAYDTASNAYVLDLNARPAPTGTQHPSWYLKDRSATIREAIDILQEVSFRHLVKTHSGRDDLAWSPLKHTHGWELLYHEALGGVQDSALLRPGECLRPYPPQSERVTLNK